MLSFKSRVHGYLIHHVSRNHSFSYQKNFTFGLRLGLLSLLFILPILALKKKNKVLTLPALQLRDQEAVNVYAQFKSRAIKCCIQEVKPNAKQC